MTTTKSFPGWEILEGAGGGYIAFRTVLVPDGSGLSNVRCGATMPELFEHLEQELRRRRRPSPTRTARDAA
ncbi:hypothetical protein [Nonomuraea sp. NPDC005650]|uniref:hypothetical protein n=1 Tax=Nonomuraea sp. NPDC005650 TaxID=3157045 RepID=UPI0033B4D273